MGTMRAELVGAGGVVERNAYLTKRYIWWDVAWFVWTVANTLTIVFIAKGIEATRRLARRQRHDDDAAHRPSSGRTSGSCSSSSWRRSLGQLGGTIEYTFMAPLSRAMHLAGQGVFAILYGLVRATFLFVICAFLFFDLSIPDAKYFAAFVVLLVASVSFIGIGMMMSVLPLISPEKGTQLGFVAQGPCSSSPASTTRSRCSRSGCRPSRRSLPRRTRSTASAKRSSTVRASRRCGTSSCRS